MSKWWGVHNDEDEVAHEHPKPEPKYEPDKVIPAYRNGSRAVGGDCERDRGRTGAKQNIRRSGLQIRTQSTRVSKFVICKRNGKWRIIRLLAV